MVACLHGLLARLQHLARRSPEHPMSRQTKLLSTSPYLGPDYGNQLVDDFGEVLA
jgi:hypothetical protein